jgi:ABC-type amino acid transport substrate-binding protein
VVGLDASFPPLVDVDAAGQVVGYEADVAAAIAGALGLRPALLNITLDGLYDALLATRIDLIIAGLQRDAHMTREVSYTAPYYNAGQVLLLRQGSPAPEGGRDRVLAALAGKLVGVESGSDAELLLRRYPQVRAQPQSMPEAAADRLLAGALDAVLADAITASELVRARPALVASPGALTDEYLLAALRRRDSARAGRVTAAIERMRRDGSLRSLAARWRLIYVD